MGSQPSKLKPLLLNLLRNRRLGWAWVTATISGAVCISWTDSIEVSRLMLPVAIMGLYAA